MNQKLYVLLQIRTITNLQVYVIWSIVLSFDIHYLHSLARLLHVLTARLYILRNSLVLLLRKYITLEGILATTGGERKKRDNKLSSYLTDVDECTDTRICPADKECINTEGSYRCRVKCSQGYERVQLTDDCRGKRTYLKYLQMKSDADKQMKYSTQIITKMLNCTSSSNSVLFCLFPLFYKVRKFQFP